MKQLLALITLVCAAMGWAALQAGSLTAMSARSSSLARKLVVVERAIKQLPCVLAPPSQKGCPPATSVEGT